MTNPPAPEPLIWHSPSDTLLQQLPSALRPHLLNTGSLTARVRELSGGVASVQLLRHEKQTPESDEASCLRMKKGEQALLRDIHLFGNNEQPWIFAHTVIPPGTLSGEGERLGRLGDKPLGEALFADPGIRRDNLQLACLSAGHGLFALAVAGLDQLPDSIWGRRSQFHLSGGGSLLVAEFFLPTHPAFRYD